MIFLKRRQLMLGGLAAAATWTTTARVHAARLDSDPFALGVASGCPVPDGFILWTRLIMADPLPAGAEVLWEVAEDDGFRRIVASGIARTEAAYGQSLHIAVTGLKADSWYYYRFSCGPAQSPVGRSRTAPPRDLLKDKLRLAIASCQQYEQGYYAAYRHMAKQDLDLVLHLGDYIYEMTWGRNLVRSHGGPPPVTLQQYRERYALYKSDPDLQAAHAAFPWLFIWDDHEVGNNYTTEGNRWTQTGDAFLLQRRAAYQAWYEHMPVPPHSSGIFEPFRIYGSHHFGRLMDLAMLDGRQYRSPQVSDVSQDHPGRSFLGFDQEAWLDAELKKSDGLWTVIAQPTLLSENDIEGGAGEKFILDGWDGYRHARSRLLNSVQGAGLRNPIIIGGDLHTFYGADIKLNFADEKAPALATEFVTGAISSDPLSQGAVFNATFENPHIKYASASYHGYTEVEVTPQSFRADLIGLANRKDASSSAYRMQTLLALDGKPGIVLG